MRVFWWFPALCRSVALGLFAIPGILSAQNYVISTVAGGSPAPASASAVNTAIGLPGRVHFDYAGNLYFTALNSVFKLSSGVITRVAGNGRAGYSGDGGSATSAQLNGPQGLAFDSAGDMYIADTLNEVVRMVSAATGNITTVAGNGTAGLDGDYGLATKAVLHFPTAVAVDSSGNLYICDSANNAIRQVSPVTGLIVPYLGSYLQGFAGDTSGQITLNTPTDIFFDTNGNLWIADYGNGRIREYGTNGIAATVVGGGGTFVEGGFPLATALAGPRSVVTDSAGNIYVADSDDDRVFKVTASTNHINTIAGTGVLGFSGDGNAGNTAQVNQPASVAIDPQGNVYFVDLYNARIREISTSGAVTTVAGNGAIYYSGDGGAAQNAIMNGPLSVAYGAQGVYIADTANQRIRLAGRDGTISTAAGNGSPGFGGDGSTASGAQLFYPGGVAVDASGFLYIADTGNQRVRKVVNGTINTVAGSGTAGYAGDGASALQAQLNQPSGLAVDSAGDIFIADFGNQVVREVLPNGTITTVAGNATPGYSGDGGKATLAQLNGPIGLALDSAGNLYIADSLNHVVRVVSPSGTINTYAGNGGLGYSGDGGLAINAQLSTPSGLAIDPTDVLYISDPGDSVVRIVTPTGVIATIGGNALPGYAGDGGAANQAEFNAQAGIALDPLGDLYIADSANNAVRLMQPVSNSPNAGALANAASNVVGSVAPGEAVTLFGSGIGPSAITNAQPDSAGDFPEQLAGTMVYFNGIPAPLVYTWAQQVGIVVPHELTPGVAQLTVQYGNQVSLELPVKVVASAPALYSIDGSGRGQALAVNASAGVLNSTSSPVHRGEVITLYLTGAGQLSPSAQDGAPNAPGSAHPLLNLSATIGGSAASVVYAGGDNGVAPGMIRVDLTVPDVSGSALPVIVTVGDTASQPVTIAVQ